MSKDAVLEKANRIIADREAERKHIKTCGDAGICPICGDGLVHVWTQDLGDYPGIHHFRCGKPKPCGQWEYYLGSWKEEPIQNKPPTLWQRIFG